MTRRPEGGFTLLELVVAMALFAVVGTAVAEVYTAAYANATKRFSEASFYDSNTLLRAALVSAVDGATYIQRPGPGGFDDALVVWTNLDDDGAMPLVPGDPVRFAELCLDRASGAVYLYRGDSGPPAAGQCGSDDSRWQRTPIVQGGRPTVEGWRFSRAAEANRVRLAFSLSQKVPVARFDGRVDFDQEVVIEHGAR